MSGPRNPRLISASAVVPEQVADYVLALAAGSRPRLFASCIGYESEGSITLVAYPPHDPLDQSAVAEAVAEGLRAAAASAARLVALSAMPPGPPPEAPPHKAEQTGGDSWWALDLPLAPPAQKLRNMLRRAAREAYVQKDPGPAHFNAEHMALIRDYVRGRPLAAGTAHIFRHIPDYLAACENSMLFSARLASDNSLAGMAVGDFTSLSTAFYLFAFRHKNAPPGTADLLLQALAEEGAARGHTRLNLGLGVNAGIAFFKKKWGAYKFLPYIETTYAIARPAGGLFAFLRKLW